MVDNPFRYGSPVTGEYFTGRRHELAMLTSRMRDGINVVVLSPRRYGKTSLLRTAEASLLSGRRPAAVVSVNVLRCSTLTALAGRLAHGAYSVPGGKWRRAKSAVADFVHRLRVAPAVTFGPDGSPRFGFDASLASADAEGVISDIFAILAEEAEGRPAVLVLDEFQAITDLDDHLPDLFKALSDEHPEVALVLAGSKAHLMARLVVDRQAPLYGMAEHLALGPIPEPEMSDYLEARSAVGGLAMNEGVAKRIIHRAGPVPNDIQRLAYEAFETASGVVDLAAVEAGLAWAVEHDAALYADRYERFAPGQRRVLIALAAAEVKSPYAASFARIVGLANAASVRKALQALESDETVVMRDGVPVVADPFFRSWLIGLEE